MVKVEYGYCACGCGQKTTVPIETSRPNGRYKGVPMTYVHGHHRRRNFLERFWEKVLRKNKDECWEWQASLNSTTGYGQINRNGNIRSAHATAYELAYGKVPDGMYVCHTCDNHKCVNPNHLFAGTPHQNTQDMMQKGRHRIVPNFGERNGNNKLTEKDVLELREMVASGFRIKDAAAHFGISDDQASKIVNRKVWKHI